MKSKVVQGLIVGMCAISLIMNVVTMSQLKDGTMTGDQTTAQGQYVVDIGSIYGDPEGEQVLQQEILEKMEENGVTFSSEDTQALIDYITEQVGTQTLTYVESVLQEEVAAQTAVLLEEKYAEYNLAELTDTQIMQINEEIVRELGNHIDAFQQSYVLTPEDVDMILDAVDLDYQMSSYLYQNGYLTGESLDNFVTSWDYRVSFQKYFTGACSNAQLMNYSDTTSIVNSVRDSLYDNIKELRNNINSIELTLQDVDAQLSDIYAEIGMNGTTTGQSSVTEKISVLQSDVSNLAQTRVTISNYEEYVQNTQTTLTSIQSSITTLAQETGQDYTELSEDISDNATSIAQHTASLNTITDNIGNLSSELIAAQSSISTLQSSVATNTTDISTLNGTVNTNGQNIITLQGNMSTAEQNITSLQGNMSTAEQNITSLQGGVSTNEQAIAALQAVVSGNNASITSLQGDVGTNTSNISGLQTTVGTLDTTVGNHTTSLTNLQNQMQIGGTNFYFDYQGGKYGYNTSPSRGADTFHPFSSTGRVGKQYLGSLSGAMNIRSRSLNISSILPNYQQLTASDFTMELVGISGGGHNNTSSGATSSLSYNPSTGVITCSGIGCCHDEFWSGAGATVNIYYLYVIPN